MPSTALKGFNQTLCNRKDAEKTRLSCKERKTVTKVVPWKPPLCVTMATGGHYARVGPTRSRFSRYNRLIKLCARSREFSLNGPRYSRVAMTDKLVRVNDAWEMVDAGNNWEIMLAPMGTPDSKKDTKDEIKLQQIAFEQWETNMRNHEKMTFFGLPILRNLTTSIVFQKIERATNTILRIQW